MYTNAPIHYDLTSNNFNNYNYDLTTTNTPNNFNNYDLTPNTLNDYELTSTNPQNNFNNYELTPTYVPVYHNSYKQYEPQYTDNIPLYIPTPEVIEERTDNNEVTTKKSDQSVVCMLSTLCFILCAIIFAAIFSYKYKN